MNDMSTSMAEVEIRALRGGRTHLVADLVAHAVHQGLTVFYGCTDRDLAETSLRPLLPDGSRVEHVRGGLVLRP
jgi:hypothetical protein